MDNKRAVYYIHSTSSKQCSTCRYISRRRWV